MTTEEKAQAYDEALKRAKEMYDAYRFSVDLSNFKPTDFEYIFPQLAESEDEKIRKDIINLIYWLKGNPSLCSQYYNDRYDDMLAYLEKQKEQKEIPLMNGDADLYFDNWIQHNDTTKRGCFEEGIRYAQRLQKEQNLIMANSPQLKEQKQEWSEEDESFLDSIEEAIDAHYDLNHAPQYHYWLEEKLKQPKQEWSEEDEKIAYTILNLLCSQVTYVTGQGTTSGKQYPTYAKERDWFEKRFKSLRPQPKRQIKEGDKVNIHCRKDRKEHIITFYDGKVGEVIHVYNAKKHPWGHIIVRLDNGCNDGFYEDELEVLDEPSWKPSDVCYGADESST